MFAAGEHYKNPVAQGVDKANGFAHLTIRNLLREITLTLLPCPPVIVVSIAILLPFSI